MPSTTNTDNQQIRREVVNRFHDELFRRYQQSYLEQIDEIREQRLLEGMSQSDIDRVKLFFARFLYPSFEQRLQRDHNLESVELMLRNPSRVMAALPSLPRLLLKHGPSIPAALETGHKVVEAYRLAGELEDQMVHNLALRCQQEDTEPEAAAGIDHQRYAEAYAATDHEKTRTLIGLTEEVVGFARRRKHVEATIEILRVFRRIASGEEEEAATDYVLHVLHEVLSIADSFSDDTMRRMVHIARLAETHYQQEMIAAWSG